MHSRKVCQVLLVLFIQNCNAESERKNNKKNNIENGTNGTSILPTVRSVHVENGKKNIIQNENEERSRQIRRCNEVVTGVCLPNEYPTDSKSISLNVDANETTVYIYFIKYFVIGVDEGKNEIQIDISQEIRWSDSRVNTTQLSKNTSVVIPPQRVKRIWHPSHKDILIYDEQQSRSVHGPNNFKKVIVKKSKDAAWFIATADRRVTLFCKFNLSSFPFDKQTCRFRQYRNLEDMHLLSTDHYILNFTDEQPYQMAYTSGGFNVKVESVGNFDDDGTDMVGFNIILRHLVAKYLWKYYIPCFSIVIVSQISFIIPLSSIPGRVCLVATNFLTLISIFMEQMVHKCVYQ